MLYFVLFSLKIRLLSPEFFLTVGRKGLCEGLLIEVCDELGLCKGTHIS